MVEHDDELVLVAGRVWTGAGEASGLAVAGGRIAAVGDEDTARAAVGPGARVVDLGGRTVVPGLVDSHIHLMRGGLTWNQEVRWADVPSLAAGMDMIRARAATTPPGTWIAVVGGWHPGQFAEGRGPTRADLDAAAPDHPAYVQRNFEEAVLNTAALEAAGFAASTEDPPMAMVERGDDGAPTGWVRGIGAFRAALGVMGMPDAADRLEGTRAMLRELNRLGLTGAIDPGGFGVVPEMYGPLFELWRRGERGFRTRLLVVPSTPGQELDELAQWARFIHPGFGDDYLSYLGFGEIVSFCAHDMEGVRPHHIDAGCADRVYEASKLAAARGFAVHIHAILDESVSAVLDAWERVNEEFPVRDLRFALVHADAISPRNLQRVRDLGVGIAVQDRLVFRAADSLALWGEETLAQAPPLGSMLAAGIPVGAGTDATVVSSHNPWRSLWWLVTGGSYDGAPPRAAEHRLSREQALRLYTAGSVWFSFEEDRRGTLEPGKWADLAVLSADYFAVPEDQIPGITSVLTMVGGRVVHAAAEFSGMAP